MRGVRYPAALRKGARARKPRSVQRRLLLRHLDGNLKDLIRDAERLTVALEDHDGLTRGCVGSQRRVKLPRPKMSAARWRCRSSQPSLSLIRAS